MAGIRASTDRDAPLDTSDAGAHATQDAQLHALFAVPVLLHQWPDVDALNAALRTTILRRWHESRGIEATNVGGWHSERDLQTWTDDCIAPLLARIDALTVELVRRLVDRPEARHLRGWSLKAWANVSARGDRNALHTHDNRPGNLWSGIYYVDDGRSAGGRGALTVFADASGTPREVPRTGESPVGEFTIEPRPGLMALFPASLPHRVDPHDGDELRITISWNLRHDGFAIPRRQPRPHAGWKAWLWQNFRGVMLPLGMAKNALRHRFLRPPIRRPTAATAPGERSKPQS